MQLHMLGVLLDILRQILLGLALAFAVVVVNCCRIRLDALMLAGVECRNKNTTTFIFTMVDVWSVGVMLFSCVASRSLSSCIFLLRFCLGLMVDDETFDDSVSLSFPRGGSLLIYITLGGSY